MLCYHSTSSHYQRFRLFGSFKSNIVVFSDWILSMLWHYHCEDVPCILHCEQSLTQQGDTHHNNIIIVIIVC